MKIGFQTDHMHVKDFSELHVASLRGTLSVLPIPVDLA
jgi:hypothetical protein